MFRIRHQVPLLSPYGVFSLDDDGGVFCLPIMIYYGGSIGEEH